jgi:hypothetical protein
MWFVDRRGGHWDLRLVRVNGKLVGVRRLRGGWLTDFAEVNGRLYWLRSRGEAVGAILESIAIDQWQSAPVGRSPLRGLSERVGESGEPRFGGMVATGDGSLWFTSSGFQRVIRLGADGAVTEWRTSSSGVPVSLAPIAGRMWVQIASMTRADVMYRLRPEGAMTRALPVINVRLGVRPSNRGKTIGLLSSLRVNSKHVIPGTTLSVRCLRACRGPTASRAIPAQALRVAASIRLKNQSRVAVTMSHPGYLPVKQIVQFTRQGRRVSGRIVSIDGQPFNVVGSCGC